MTGKDDKKPDDAGKKRLTLYEQMESGGLASLASMEGAWNEWTDASAPETPEQHGRALTGVLAALAVTALAWWAHRLPFAPFTLSGGALEHPIGVSALAILLGMVVANIVPTASMRAGCQWITAWCIPIAVVMLGAGMDLHDLGGIGWSLFVVVLLVMLVAVGAAYWTGRALGMMPRAAYLLGMGTAVCGSSAILATSPVCDADAEDVVVTVGVVNLVGLLAMFGCVMTLWFIPMDAGFYGAWAGATIHAVPQVIAAGESHGADAAAVATLVKLTRVTMLAPLVVLTALVVSRRRPHGGSGQKTRLPLWRYIPWFVWGFVAIAGIRASGWLPALEFAPEGHGALRLQLSEGLPFAAKWLLAVSMAAIGLQVHLRPMLRAGAKAMAAGVIAWLVMALAAVLLLRLVL